MITDMIVSHLREERNKTKNYTKNFIKRNEAHNEKKNSSSLLIYIFNISPKFR